VIASRADRAARLISRPVHYAVLLLVHLELLLHPMKAGGYDWWGFFHPTADALRRIVLQYHQFPWWNPWSLGGTPLFADPQVAVISPDTLLVLLFGAVLGPKLALIGYTILGYEGTRLLCRHLFAREAAATRAEPEPAHPDRAGSPIPADGAEPSRPRAGQAPAIVLWFAVLPALLPALAGHLAVGHYSFVAFHLFPWLLVTALRWRRGPGWSVGLGVAAGFLALTYPHYMTVMSFSIAMVVIGYRLAGTRLRRRRVFRRERLLVTLAVSVALGLSLTRVCLSVHWLQRYRRPRGFYPMTIGLREGLTSLVVPFRSGRTDQVPIRPTTMGRWEVDCYVGGLSLLVVLAGLRQRRRWRFSWIHAAVPLLLLLAWTNGSPWAPSYWLRRAPPWSSLIIVTRWRLFACYFLMLAVVGSLAAIDGRGWRRVAWVLGALILCDVGFHV